MCLSRVPRCRKPLAQGRAGPADCRGDPADLRARRAQCGAAWKSRHEAVSADVVRAMASRTRCSVIGPALACLLHHPCLEEPDYEVGWRRQSVLSRHHSGSGTTPVVTPKTSMARGLRRSGTIGALFVLLVGAGPIYADPSTSRPSFILRHQVEAEVSEVDAGARVLRLKTETGRLSLDTTGAPAAALKRGDWVVVDVVLIRHADPPRLPRPHEDPPSLLTQRLRGSITAIHRTLGVIAVTTPAGRLTLELPSAAMAGLRTGSPVGVELAVRQPDVSASPGSGASRSKKGLGALMLMLFGRTK